MQLVNIIFDSALCQAIFISIIMYACTNSIFIEDRCIAVICGCAVVLVVSIIGIVAVECWFDNTAKVFVERIYIEDYCDGYLITDGEVTECFVSESENGEQYADVYKQRVDNDMINFLIADQEDIVYVRIFLDN
jgi:hypothetical protein